MSRLSSPLNKKAAPRKEEGPLDVRRIVCATRSLVECSGVESVTMRRVAAELGVSAMGLYHHVSDKQALLALVADDVMGSVDFPGPETGPWYERIRQNMLWVHNEVSRYPGLGFYIWGANGLYPSYPRGYRQICVAFNMLLEAGFDDREAMSALHVLSAYEGGHFMVEHKAHSDQKRPPESVALPDDAGTYLSSLPESFSSMEIYQQGLDTILSGLRAQLAAKQVLIKSTS